MFFVERNGQASGLGLFWNDQTVIINVIASCPRFIHSSVKIIDSGISFLCTFTDAFPQKFLQPQLWHDLLNLHGINTNVQPWILVGDFNNILSPSEKVGG